MFADDVKLYLRIINDVDVGMLEYALTALSHWAQDWQLTTSVEKCCVMHVGTVDMSHKLTVDDSVLPVKSSCRDLGIIINKDLSFTEHVNSIVYKAHQRANAIHRCFESRNVNLSLRAYMVYVRPLLEHNTVIWSPHLKDNLEAIERVQRRFTKRLPGLNNFTYSERLYRLGIPTLELRRLRSDLIWCYKITFGCINATTTEFLMRRSTSSTRGHRYKLYKQHSSCTARSSFIH